MDEPLPQIYVTGASGVLGSELALHFSRIPGRRLTAVSRRPCPSLPADHPGHRRVGLRTTTETAPGGVQSNALCCERAREVLDWQAEIPLETGLRELLERKNADPELR